ncbi:MAG TPA: prepilin-type N-terminal cleavage/methylation domain-containing protein [Anaerolineae bacterium]
MGRKGGLVRQPISSARHDDSRHGEEGFTLLEVVCVVAILAILAAVALPGLPRGTSKARLQSYATATAALLKADRYAALRRQAPIATEVNAASRLVRSGATGRIIRVPDDVTFDALLAERCDKYPAGSSIRFFPSGMSCGGVIALTRASVGYEVRVNWLTGGVDIVALNRT